ncbi:MAG: hypothetical protein EAY72_08370 [Bacteroidetes bacterium]|nr:MAG: hypothetical protein EAY72_08370 [Bacteroidota bacterium]
MPHKKYLSLLIILFVHSFSWAQFTAPNATVHQAISLFNSGQYSAAYRMFQQLPVQASNLQNFEQEAVLVYPQLIELQQNVPGAKQRCDALLPQLQTQATKQQLLFELGNYSFGRKQFSEAKQYYQQLTLSQIANNQIATVRFHKAYIFFTENKWDSSLALLDGIRQIQESNYYIDANYYYGFIQFYKKNYGKAQQAFDIVQNEPAYKNIVPYYIAQLLYFQRKPNDALAYANDKINKGGQYYQLQLQQLAGHIYFENKAFDKALPLLENYVQQTPTVRKEDLYELSYCYYQAKQWNKAITGFKELSNGTDSLAQNSMYLLADAFLQVNDKPSARNAFLFCANNSNNKLQQQIASFHYAKLSYDIGFNDVALQSMQNFLKSYPTSAYKKEAQQIQLLLLAQINNYQEAIDVFTQLEEKTEVAYKAYATAAFGRATELLSDGKLHAADTLLNQLYQQPWAAQTQAGVCFVKSEIQARLGVYDSAIYYADRFLDKPNEQGSFDKKYALYNKGFSWFQLKQYPSAQPIFQRLAEPVNSNASEFNQDVTARLADALFMNKQYAKAFAIYQELANSSGNYTDYAVFQQAIIRGAQEKLTEKIALLNKLLQSYAGSKFRLNAQLEKVNTQLFLEQYENALQTLQEMQAEKNSQPWLPTIAFKRGVCLFNLNKNDLALEAFNVLLEKYPNTTERNDAIEYMKSIYLEQQNTQAYLAFMQKVGEKVSTESADSLTYTVLAKRWNVGVNNAVYAEAIQYLQQFPNGKYVLPVNYSMANYWYKEKQWDSAVYRYQQVIEKAPNQYVEPSLLAVARTYYFEKADYAQAEIYFTQLKQQAQVPANKIEAMRGLLRAQYKLQKMGDAVPNAKELLAQTTLTTDEKILAQMVLAKAFQINNQRAEAIAQFKQVIALGKNEYSAEARYTIAELLVADQKLPEAEKAAFEVINKAGSYPYWITKSYILLGEIYGLQQDFFNAEATLKSVVDNADIPALKEEAQRKLLAIQNQKANQSKIK